MDWWRCRRHFQCRWKIASFVPGSVVTKDIPDNSIAVGNPCKVIRQINDKDREYINSLILDDETKDSKYKQANRYIYHAKDELFLI